MLPESKLKNLMVATTTLPDECMMVNAGVVRTLVKKVYGVETSNWALDH